MKKHTCTKCGQTVALEDFTVHTMRHTDARIAANRKYTKNQKG